MTTSAAEVIVIGAGVTGLSAAWWLARSGVKVLVLDKGVLGHEASSRNGGGASHYQSPLFHEEQRLWPLMDDMLGYTTEYRRERVIFATTEHHLKHYRHIGQMCRDIGYPVDDLDPRQVREVVTLAGYNVTGGIHLRFGGQANPQRTVQAYAWALQDLGGRIIQHCPATKIMIRAGKVSGVETPRGPFACDHLVVAAGPQSEALLAQVAARLPLAAARAEMIVTEPGPIMPVGGADGNGLYGRQTLRGNLAYGGGPHEWLQGPSEGPTARPSSPLLRNLAKRLAELLPKASHLRVIRGWAGVVENTPDGRPVIDRLHDPGNLTVATMSGVGFGLSPASGRAIRDLVIEGRCTFADIDKFTLARFSGLTDDWRDLKGWTATSHEAARERMTPRRENRGGDV